MGRERAFDHDLLKRLVLAHPDWTDERYAEILTEHNRATNPSAPAVRVNTVGSVLYRNRAAWGVPNRWVTYTELLPPAGVLSPKHKNCTILRYLRALAADARGEKPDTESGRRLLASALRWRRDIETAGMIVDIDITGKPIVRHPVKSELNGHGKPRALVAWMLWE
jgi:hypothetical protein